MRLILDFMKKVGYSVTVSLHCSPVAVSVPTYALILFLFSCLVAREKFCHTLEKYPDLMAKLDTRKVQC